MDNTKFVYLKLIDYKEDNYVRLEAKFSYHPEVFKQLFSKGFKRNKSTGLFYVNISGDNKKERVKEIVKLFKDNFGKYRLEQYNFVKKITNINEIEQILGIEESVCS